MNTNLKTMKRILTALAATTTIAMSAVTTPVLYEGGSFKCFSPNGNYAIQDPGDQSPMVIMDLVNNQDYPYMEEYGSGHGNCISDNGVVVGYSISKERAAYWQNGVWKELNVGATTALSYANGITPDGKIIVGSISPLTYAGDYEGIMLVPVYWQLNGNGVYEGPKNLPYPTVEFTNRKPQYVTAIRISEDGKTIAGQMKDYLGMVCQPVIYTCDDSGTWSYELLVEELFHPEGYELPEYPGDGPVQQDFMTPEEIKAYDEAVENWNNSVYDAPYPEIDSYMTEEEKAAFVEAASIWLERYTNFEDALWRLLAVVPNFEYNNVYMTTDGKQYATTDTKYFIDEARELQYRECAPYLIDIESDTYKKFPGEGEVQVMLSGLADDGTLIGQVNDDIYGLFNGYICPAGKENFIPIYDFIEKVDKATAEWMKENMTHTYDKYDFETGEIVPTTITATGIPFCTPDMSLIGFAQYSFWNYTNEYQYYGYLISLPPYAGVEELSDVADDFSIKILPGGTLDIEGTVSSLQIYSLNGLKVYAAENITGILNTNLSKGIYVIKADGGKGNVYNKKIVIR